MTDGSPQFGWPAILDAIRRRVPEAQFRTWFQPIGEATVSPRRIELRVPNEYFREWIGREYTALIQNAADEVLGARPQVGITVDPALLDSESRKQTILTGLSSELQLNPDFSFDNFVVGPSNRLAYAGAVAVASNVGQVYNPLYIHGPVGLGKSHLLQAICNKLVDDGAGYRVVYTSCEMFVNEFISAIQHARLDDFRQRCRQADVLVIDDVQFLTRAERSQEEFFHTFNTLHNAQRQIVISADSEPDEMPTIETRLTSRFKSGLVVRLDMPTLETRAAILKRKAEQRGWELPDDVLHFVAERFTRSIRELEGALIRLTGYASLSNTPITMDLALAALAVSDRMAAPVGIEHILNIVSSYYNVRIPDLQSKQRKRSVVLPRQICMYLARRLTDISLEEIGGYFGGRDHSTVLYATQKISELDSIDPAFHGTLVKLELDVEREAERKSR